MNNKIHIVSFDNPYPPIYGGVIDVFHKIVALHKTGFQIYLHIFSTKKSESSVLNEYCENIFYYKRNTSISNFISSVPFIVKTRNSNELRKNLLKIDAPILFEGIHTISVLKNSEFKNRKILIRTHNIEHDYYKGLYHSESNKFKQLYFKIESKKLKQYEHHVEKADIILSISPFDQEYFNSKYKSKVVYLPAFHQNKIVKKLTPRGNYSLYQGDLRVSDNIKSVRFLLEIFKGLDLNLKVASGFIDIKLLKEITSCNNVDFVKIESNNHLSNLISNAHMNILPTFQKTGIKLKLINALFNGRFCLVNPKLVDDTGLEHLCEIADSVSQFKEKIEIISNRDFTPEITKIREKSLALFNNDRNAQLIRELLN